MNSLVARMPATAPRRATKPKDVVNASMISVKLMLHVSILEGVNNLLTGHTRLHVVHHGLVEEL